MDTEDVPCLLCTVQKAISHPEGRYVILMLEIYQTKMVMACVHVPLPFQPQLLYMLVILTPYMHLPLLLSGDFNAILDGGLDASNPLRLPPTEFLSWVSAALRTELWRWKYPGVRSYSCLSHTHRTASRIDLAFANLLRLNLVHAVTYLAGGGGVRS